MTVKPSLKGKRIVLTRSISGANEWKKYLKQQGALVYQFPTIEVSAVASNAKLTRILRRLDDFGWLVFTSAEAPHFLKEFAKKSHINLPTKRRMPWVAAIGEKTAHAVRNIGYRVACMPSRSDSATLARELKPLRTPILLLRADIASKELPRALEMRGADVFDIPIYKTKILYRPDPRFSQLLKDGEIDYVTFASPSAVRGFVKRVKGSAMESAQKIPAIGTGPRVQGALERVGFRDIRIAREPTIKGIVDAMLRS